MEILKQFLMEQDLPRRAQACYQCGACAGGCPIGKWRWDFNPRQVIVKILRNEVSDIIQDNKIWLCVTCLTCLERCPQKIEVSEIMVQLKNAAARIGNIPENEIKKSRQIMKNGWIQDPGKRIFRIRQELGLPEIPKGIESSELQDMAHSLGWQEKIQARENIDAQMADGSRDHPTSAKKDETGE